MSADTEDDLYEHTMCDPGYEQCREYQGSLKARRTEIETLRALAREVIDADDEVEREAKRAARNNGAGWSSAPSVRRLYAMKALRAFINQ